MTVPVKHEPETDLNKYSIKELISILKKLKNGAIGFDPYRNPETSKKAGLIAYILNNHSAGDIYMALVETGQERAALDSVNSMALDAALTHISGHFKKPDSTPNEYTVRFYYKDLDGTKKTADFSGSSYEYAEQNALKWMALNPGLHSVMPGLVRLPRMTMSVQPEPEERSMNPQQNKPEAEQLAALLLKLSSNQGLDTDAIKKLIDARHADHIDNLLETVNKRLDSFHTPTVVNVIRPDIAEPVKLGTQHKKFPELLKMVQARTLQNHRLNIWLKGQPGTGKTTAAKAISQALGLEFYFNGALTTEYDLLGFKDAHGNYQPTSFRKAYEMGGVYLFDEVDASLPRAVLAFNAALDNGVCTFPDKPVHRHHDFICLAGANTSGTGATGAMTARTKQDEASRDRFVYLDWELDPALERALSQDSDWLKCVITARTVVSSRQAQHFITPRAVIYGDALLKAGVPRTQVIESCLIKGCEPTLAQALRDAVSGA